MEDEHFGISVADMWVAGLFVVAHNSGGPKDDILTSGKGGGCCLVETNEEFSKGIVEGLNRLSQEKPETHRFKNATDFGSSLVKLWFKFD